jgi:hypothetical protein
LIPWNLNTEILMKGLERLKAGESCEAIAMEYAPEAVMIFKSWVGEETWVLLFEVVGYCLIPDYPLNTAFMFCGDGANGKSTYLRLLKVILGEHNVTGHSLQELCTYRFAAAELYHKLANIYPDLPPKGIPDMGMFKALTGEDWISAPRKFKDALYMKNYAKLIFSANETPDVNDQSYANWRRWVVIEFPNRFPNNPRFFEENFKPDLIERIIVLGLLAFWLVWHRKSFSVKGSAQEFKEAWMRARISRGLFKCTRLNKVFNADLAAAHNILMTPITPSPERGRSNGPETRPRAELPRRENVAQTSPHQREPSPFRAGRRSAGSNGLRRIFLRPLEFPRIPLEVYHADPAFPGAEPELRSIIPHV